MRDQLFGSTDAIIGFPRSFFEDCSSAFVSIMGIICVGPLIR